MILQNIGAGRIARENRTRLVRARHAVIRRGPWRARHRSGRKNRPIAICHLASLSVMCD
jgi:hypothetical protein